MKKSVLVLIILFLLLLPLSANAADDATSFLDAVSSQLENKSYFYVVLDWLHARDFTLIVHGRTEMEARQIPVDEDGSLYGAAMNVEEGTYMAMWPFRGQEFVEGEFTEESLSEEIQSIVERFEAMNLRVEVQKTVRTSE